MYWVIQNNLYSEEGFYALTQALNRLELPYSLHKCVPFVGTIEPEVKPTQDKVIVMGSLTLALEAKKRGWNPGSFMNDNFNYAIQLGHWGNYMLNADMKVYDFKDVPESLEPFFIRPIEDTKSFTGVVLDWPSFMEWQDRVMSRDQNDNRNVRPDTKVMVCKYKRIWTEYRTWIVNKKVVAWSQYKTGILADYKANVDERILQFAQDRAEEWSPHRAYVMDVCEINDGLRIIEVNCLNSAGFYKANMGKLIMALEEVFG